MIDLNKLEENLDNSLEKETKESLTEFINKQRDSREEGYYFVKYRDKWMIAFWEGDDETIYGWNLIGYTNEYKDSLFQEIGDKIELPNN